MKSTLSRTLAAAAVIGRAAFGSAAQARTAVSFGFNLPLGGYGYYPAPAYVAPPVAYAAPAPVYYAPPPAYYAPAPVYYAPPRVVYRPRVWVRPAPVVGVGVRVW